MPLVILADKSDLFRRSITSVLQREGYDVVTADTGHKVMTLAQDRTPSAIILDTETPEPGGLETMLLMKKDPKLRRVPVVVVSRDSAPSAVSNAFKMGAESFMLKPIDLNALLKTLGGLQVPVPALGSPLRVTFGHRHVEGSLRFIDQYGMVYIDKAPDTDLEVAASAVWDPRTDEEKHGAGPAIGESGMLAFEANDHQYHQRVLLSEHNEQGFAVYPVGDPSQSDSPDMLRVPVNYKARYLIPGSFMKLADVGLLHGHGLHMHGLVEEPGFNSEVKVTLYPQSVGGTDGGIALKGKITASRPGNAGYEIEVQLTEAPGLPYVNLMAELIGGRPSRA